MKKFSLVLLFSALLLASCSTEPEDTSSDKIGVTGITINCSQQITEGYWRYLKATVSPENATNKNVVWETIDNEYAGLNENGEFEARKVNEEGITVSVYSADNPSIKASLTIRIVPGIPVESISIKAEDNATSIVEGNQLQLKAEILPTNATKKEIVWSSSDTNYATVSYTGNVTALRATDNVTITATSKDKPDVYGTFNLKITPVEYSEGLEYELLEDGSGYRVKSLGTCTSIVISIPPEHEGLPVKEIGENAFDNWRIEIIDIKLPNTIKKISDRAFSSVGRLTSFRIPDSVEIVGDKLFSHSYYMEELWIGKNVKTLGENWATFESLKKIYYNAKKLETYEKAFAKAGCVSDGIDVIIGSDVEIIPEYLFTVRNESYNNPKIKTITFENESKCKKICQKALESELVESIALPESIETVENYALKFPNLKQLNYNCKSMVPQQSSSPSWIRGDDNGYDVVFGKNVESLADKLFYANTVKTFRFEDGSKCKSFGERAFYQNTLLTEVELPVNLETVGANCFEKCENITIINLNSKDLTFKFYENDIYKKPFSSYTRESLTLKVGPKVDKIPNYICNNVGATSVIFEVNSKCSYIGDKAFYNLSNCQFENFPTFTITHYGEECLSGCSSLSIDALSENVTYIGKSAFYGTPAVKVARFKGENIIIETCAFYGNNALEELEIGPGVIKIGALAFYGTKNLKKVKYDANATDFDFTYDNRIFDNSGTDGDGIKVIIGKNATEIPSNLFFVDNKNDWNLAGPNKVVSVEFEDGSICRKIGEKSFTQMNELKTLKLPESMEEVGEYAFTACGIEDLYLNANLHKVGRNTFTLLRNLKNVTYNCKSLECLDEDNDPASCLMSNRLYAPGEGEDIVLTIGKDVEKLPEKIFDSFCETILKFEEGFNCKEIGKSAFKSNNYLRSINIPDCVEIIRENAFAFCYRVETITIGEGVKTIGNNAFINSSLLKELNFNAVECDDVESGYAIFSRHKNSTRWIDKEYILTIGKNVKRIPAYIFNQKNRTGGGPDEDRELYFTQIIFEEGSVCTSIGEGAFNHINWTDESPECVNVPENLKINFQ